MNTSAETTAMHTTLYKCSSFSVVIEGNYTKNQSSTLREGIRRFIKE